MTTIGSLCSGYRGLDMAVQAVIGGTVVWDADNDPDACKVLAHHWPGVPNLGDITAVDWRTVPPVDVMCGGTPCQDVSHAGARRGMRAGTRSGLWSAMADAVDVLRPQLVVWENVGGAFSASADSGVEPCPGCVGDGTGVHLRALGRVLGDLADLGYDAQWCGLRASDVGAAHGRPRVFVVAENAHGAARGEWRVTAPGQTEGRGPRADARGRGGTPAADSLGGELQRRGVGGVLGAAPRGTEGARGERERDGHAPGDRRSDVADAARHSRWFGDGDDVPAGREGADWGEYAGAVGRWAATLGRPAPAPTEPGRGGQPRLRPAFVEWMMGLPAGHVTAVPGVTRNAQLRILGNGVVPQQAEAAVRWLLTQDARAAA